MRVTIQVESSVYRVAGTAENVDGIGCFEERLLNSVSLVRTFSRAGYTPVTLPINIRNNDWFIPRELDLWGAFVTVEGMSQTWAGQITGFEYDMAGVLYVTATEKTAPELLEMVPDEVVHLFTVSESTHQSAIDVTLPLVVGGTVADPILVKGILYDKINGIYLLCVGEIRQVVKVYSGTDELTEGFVAYTGTADQGQHPGFCFVQITDPAKRKNDDGSYAAISAEIVGLKLGSHTLEECRNGARFLLWFLKTAKSGTNAWGLGVSESDIDLDSFAASIAKVDAAGLKMDGILYFRQHAMSWIDQICNAIRGRYRISKNGKRNLFVDAPASSVKTYSPALSNIKLLQYGKGAYVGRVYNKGRLEYSYNPITGIFMQSDTYENAQSIAKIDEQKFTGQSYLLRDAATAKAILDYTCQKSQTAAWKVQFETLELPDDAADGQVITVNHPAHSITGLFQIVRIQITDFVHVIEAERYSVDDFVSGTPGTTIAWTKDVPISSAINPGQASGLTLSSEVRSSPGSTNHVVLIGRFTPPVGGYLAASVEYAQGILPILEWNDHGMLQGGSFEIAPVKAGQPYAVRIRMMSPTGKSDFITGTITVQGDDIPPGKPSISATSSLKNVSINLSLASVPSDMAGFEIYRNTSNNSGTATKIGYVESTKGIAKTVDLETEYGSSYYYWAKAVDTWGNPSVFSDAFGPLTISMILNNDVSPEAIRQAIGSVASWSAKNCTTASIAEASGVKDVSGNGNHGRAYGGVAVVDSEVGKAFQFDGSNDYIDLSGVSVGSGGAMTLSFWVNLTAETTGDSQVLFDAYSPRLAIYRSKNSNNLKIYDVSEKLPGVTLSIGELALLSFVFDGSKITVYKNGINGGEVSSAVASLGSTVTMGVRYSKDTLFAKGIIFDPRIYSRALSATEIKSLYMFPGDVAFGRITSDLVTTGQLITLSAQIANALINDAHINNVNAAKLTAGFINAARYEGGSITVDKLKVGKAGAALNDDPNFEDPTAWSSRGSSANVFSTTTVGKVGNNIIFANGVSIRPITAKRIPIDAAKQYRIKAWIYQNNSTTTLNYITARYADSGGTLGSQQWPKALTKTTPGWEEISVVVTPPAGSASVIIGLDLNYNVAAGVAVYAQDFRIEEVLPETLIKDGAITTNKLTSDQIIGKDIRTAPNVGSGTSGVKFTSTGIEAWQNTTRTVLIDASGNAAFSGDISGSTGNFAGQVVAGDAFILSPTNGAKNYGVHGLSSYTGYFSIYVGPLGTLSQGVSVSTRVRVQIGDLLMEIGGSIQLRAAANTWLSDCYVKIIAGRPVASKITVRFKTSTSGTTGFFIVIGNNNDWGYGFATVIDAIYAVGTLTLEDAAGTVNYTRYGTKSEGDIVAWAYFNAIGTLSIVNSAGISSITDNGVGDYTLNFENALPSSNYAVTTGEGSFNGVPTNVSIVMGIRSDNGTSPTLKTTTRLRLASGSAANGAAYDNNNLSVLITL
jgi:hypothetical protein